MYSFVSLYDKCAHCFRYERRS